MPETRSKLASEMVRATPHCPLPRNRLVGNENTPNRRGFDHLFNGRFKIEIEGVTQGAFT